MWFIPKNAGTAGTTGTASVHAGLSVPATGDSAGTRGDKWGGTGNAQDHGGLFVPACPRVIFSAGTLEALYSCGVPSCPRCPREKHGEVK
jgi:hypothetical protein